MKIARVFVSEYPGRQVGDIFDVIDPANHPGVLLSGTIKECEVEDNFDASIMDANIDPETGEVSFVVSEAKQAVKAAAGKTAQIGVAYAAMDKDVFDEMEEVFGTRRADSANAYYETWKLMKDKPELFAAEGLVAEKAVGSFVVGDALNTNQLVQDYANARIAEVEAYGVNRAKRIKQFQVERAAILAG